MAVSFTHLETYSYYTLLGSTLSVADLVARASAEGMSHQALTDTNALYGVLAFNRACQAAGLQAILGMTVTVAAEAGPSAIPEKTPGHLVLLATGPAGYRSLYRLSSLIQGSPDREQRAARGLAWAALAEHRAGLICLGGGRQGWLERLLRVGDQGVARAYARRLAGLYGDNAWLSLELYGPADEAVAREVAAIGQEVGLPCAAVQPVYCLTRQDRAKLRLLAAIERNCRLEGCRRRHRRLSGAGSVRRRSAAALPASRRPRPMWLRSPPAVARLYLIRHGHLFYDILGACLTS